MNPHIRKDILRGGRFVQKKHLTKARFAPHRRVAKVLRKALIMAVGIPKGAKVRFGESVFRHFVIVDHLADYYATGDDFLPRRVRKNRDSKRRRCAAKYIIRQEVAARLE